MKIRKEGRKQEASNEYHDIILGCISKTLSWFHHLKILPNQWIQNGNRISNLNSSNKAGEFSSFESFDHFFFVIDELSFNYSLNKIQISRIWINITHGKVHWILF